MVCFFNSWLALVGVASIVLIVCFIYYHTKKMVADFEKRGLKYVSLPSFLWIAIRGGRLEVTEHEKVKEHGTMFGTSVFMTKAILVAEPELIQSILSKEFTNFTDRRTFKFVDDEFSNSFLSLVSGEKWKRIRSVITPTFASGKLRQMQPRIDMALETLIKNIEGEMKKHPEEDIDVKRLFGGFTMDTIIQVAYGMKIDSLNDDHPIIKYAKKAFQNMSIKMILTFSIMFFAPKLAQLLRLKATSDVTDYFKDFSTKIIDKRKKDLAEMKAKGESFKANNFLDFMLEAESEMKETNSEEEMKTKYISNIEMIAQCVLFFLAGYETTASALTFTIHCLMVNPDIQERVYDEINEVLAELEQENQGNEDNKKDLELVTLDTLPRFKLLGAVLDETLRLYAPANFLERTCVNDVTIETEDKKHRLDVKKGDLIHIPVYVVHRDERYWGQDPEKFDPDRFLGERDKEHHRYSYLAFGQGPRRCVAQTFAIMEARMALLHCLYNFRFSVGAKTSIPPKFVAQSGLVTPLDCFTSVERRNH